jgi:hypothetical protein
MFVEEAEVETKTLGFPMQGKVSKRYSKYYNYYYRRGDTGRGCGKWSVAATAKCSNVISKCTKTWHFVAGA